MKTATLITSAILAAIALPAQADGLSHLPLLSEVAPGAVQISPHVPHMGTHWANPADMPNGGPIYCVIDGRVVCVEYMFTAADLAAGRDWVGLAAGMETPAITRIDLEYKADGVGPVQQPLYQLHLYFAETEVLAQH